LIEKYTKERVKEENVFLVLPIIGDYIVSGLMLILHWPSKTAVP